MYHVSNELQEIYILSTCGLEGLDMETELKMPAKKSNAVSEQKRAEQERVARMRCTQAIGDRDPNRSTAEAKQIQIPPSLALCTGRDGAHVHKLRKKQEV